MTTAKLQQHGVEIRKCLKGFAWKAECFAKEHADAHAIAPYSVWHTLSQVVGRKQSPSGHAIEHVVAESQVLVLGQHLGTLGHVRHLNEGDQLIRVFKHLPELAHVAQTVTPFLCYMQQNYYTSFIARLRNDAGPLK